MKKLLLILSACILSTYSFAQTQNWLWARSAGGSEVEELGHNGYSGGKPIAKDAHGNIYITGHFESDSISFGNFTLHNHSSLNGDIYLVKYDAAGNVLWAASAGGTGYEKSIAVAVDTNDDVIITGTIGSNSAAFGTITVSTTFEDFFVAKYTSSGTPIWVRTSTSGNAIGNALVTDKSGNLYVAGLFNSAAMTVGSTTLNNAGEQDIFLLKYSLSGSLLSAKAYGGLGHDMPHNLGIDGTNNVFMTGSFNSSVLSFGTATLSNSDTTHFHTFTCKLSSSLSSVWAQTTDGLSGEGFRSLVIDPNGDVVVAGEIGGTTFTFGPSTLSFPNITHKYPLVAKYSSAGVPLWAAAATATYGLTYATGVTVDAAGNIYLAGLFGPTITFGNITLTGNNFGSGFIMKYTSAGTPLIGISVFGSASGSAFGNCTILADGTSLYLAGHYYSSLNFGTIGVTSAGIDDVVLAKYGDVLGVNDISSEELLLYPQPNDGRFTIELPDGKRPNSIRVVDMKGAMAEAQTSVTENKVTVRLQDAPNGIYLVMVNCDGTIYRTRVTVTE